MTEDEARTKWCPYINVGGNDGYKVTNRGKPLHDDQWFCIASECMAFRWVILPKKAHPMSVIYEPDQYSETDGYCGLAGKP